MVTADKHPVATSGSDDSKSSDEDNKDHNEEANKVYNTKSTFHSIQTVQVSNPDIQNDWSSLTSGTKIAEAM